jgi:hypothetical protein
MWCFVFGGWLGGIAKSWVVRAGDKFNGIKSIGMVVETDAPQLSYHIQVFERVVVRFLYFVCNFLYRLGLKRPSKYLDNLSLRFGGVILAIHCR